MNNSHGYSSLPQPIKVFIATADDKFGPITTVRKSCQHSRSKCFHHFARWMFGLPLCLTGRQPLSADVLVGQELDAALRYTSYCGFPRVRTPQDLGQ